MTEAEKQSSDFTINKLLVDSLVKDGVICSSFNKNYDEQATYEGGLGNRRRFTLQNEKIIAFHQVLKVLTGEWRANIHEAIPAIDFLNRENTDIMNTYLVEDDVVHSDTIISIPSTTDSVLQDIIDEDPYTINKAVSGKAVAEHFYNAAGGMSEANCLVSPPSESLTNFAYVYKGIQNTPMIIYDSDGIGHSSVSARLDKMMFLAPRIGETCVISYDPDLVTSSKTAKDDWDNEGPADEYGTLILQKGFVEGKGGNTFVNEDDSPFTSNAALARLFSSVATNSEKSLAVALNNGDFCLILPNSLTSLDSTRLLIFKKDIDNGGYNSFIAYAVGVTYSTDAISIDIGDSLPTIPDSTEGGTVIDTAIMEILSKYIAIEKEYYSKASGLLCGAFSEPAEVTDLGGTRVVTKWKFINDTDEAAKRSTSVPIGAKLYPSYLLGRGTIKDAPLATSETYIENGVTKQYNGQATWMFDTIANRLTNIYDKYETGIDEWNRLTDVKLDGVITKDDWTNRPSLFQYPNKFKTNAGKSITYDEIIAYISKASKAFKLNEDGTYTIELDKSDPFAEYCYRTDQNTGVFDWGWVRTQSGWSGNGASGNSLGSDYRHMFRLQWTTRRRKSGAIIDSASDLSVKVMSPYRAYSKWGTSMTRIRKMTLPEVLGILRQETVWSNNAPYLLWASDNTVFPEKLLLLSTTSLGVDPGENGKNTICFYNDEDNKSILFEVTGLVEFPASKVTRVSWYNEATSEYCSRDCFVDDAESHDCYVYTLEHLSMDLEEIEFTDKAGNLVAEIPVLKASIVPLSYPRDYFKCNISSSKNGTFRYLLKDTVAASSLLSLANGSTIIPGMPSLSKLLAGDTRGVRSDKLAAFEGIRKVFSTGGAYATARSSLIKNSLYSLLYNRPVSDKTGISDTGELIVLGEVPDIIDGLKTLPPYLNDIVDAGFTVNGKKLTTHDFEDFYKRLETFEEFKSYPDFALSYTPITADTVINGQSLRSYITGRLPETGYFGKDELNNIFKDAVSLAVKHSIKFVATGTSTSIKPRPSLTTLANILRNIFDTTVNSEITRKDCETLDNYFGNNTKAFLITREDPSDEIVPETTASLAENSVDAYAEIIETIDGIFKTDVKEREITSIVKYKVPEEYAALQADLLQLKADIRAIYERYFKSSSIEILGTLSPSVTVSKLVIDPAKVTADFNTLKNDPNRFVRSQYGWSWAYDYSSGGGFFRELARSAANSIFYLAFRISFGKSAWNTCDEVMRTWPSMSLDTFMTKYALYSETTTGLSKATARIHNYLIDTVTTNRKGSASKEAFYSTAAKIRECMAKQAAVDAARREAENYTDSCYLGLSQRANIFSAFGWLSWRIRKLFTEAFSGNKKGYIKDWIEDSSPEIKDPTRYNKVDGSYVEAANGIYIKESQIAAAYKGYFTSLIEDGYLLGNQKTIALPLPIYSDQKNNLIASSSTVQLDLPPYRTEKLDINHDILTGIASFARTALEGTSTAGADSYFVRFEPGDEDVTGRPNSLYFERYLYLNARLNKSNGTLYQAAQFSKSGKVLATNAAIDNQLKKVNRKYFTVVPVEWANELSYFKPQMLEKMNTFFPGKFYYKQQLLDMARQINDRCMLTCGYCPVKDNCPFYGEDEVLKLACTSAPSIDLYVKDNVPDLIYYDEGTAVQNNGRVEVIDRSPSLYYEEDGSKEELSHDLLKSYSRPYASISKKAQASRDKNGSLIYEEDYSSLYRDLTALENKTKKAIGGLDFNTEVPTGLGWLTGGRWGTLQRNRLSENPPGLSSPDYPAGNFPHNKYYYDAVFLNDEETEVLYTPSQNWYDVEVTTAESMDSDSTPKTYKGKTRINIPTALKAFAERPYGDVYLVSDDTMDDQGNPITPVIYLGKVEDIKYAFDLREEGSNQDEITNSSDGRLYPKDVAQWSINVAKGNCTQDKIDPDAFTKADDNPDSLSHGYDQYWMETLKKRVVVNGEERILELEGRPRRNAGYSEVVLDPDNMNEYEVISGRPVAARKIDFLRKVSFRILSDDASDTNDGYNLIPWCKDPGDSSKPVDGMLYTDVQKSVLPFMKTNLRLVVCEVER